MFLNRQMKNYVVEASTILWVNPAENNDMLNEIKYLVWASDYLLCLFSVEVLNELTGFQDVDVDRRCSVVRMQHPL